MMSIAGFPTACALLVAALLASCGGSTRGVTHPALQTRVAFVHCVRSHGVRNFPYPTARGRVSVETVRARGINPQSPAVARAVSECLPPWLRPPK